MCEARNEAFGWAIIVFVALNERLDVYREMVGLWLGTRNVSLCQQRVCGVDPGWRAGKPKSHSRKGAGVRYKLALDHYHPPTPGLSYISAGT